MNRRIVVSGASLGFVALLILLYLVIRKPGEIRSPKTGDSVAPAAETPPDRRVEPPPGPTIAVADLQALHGGRVSGSLTFIQAPGSPSLQIRYRVRRLPVGRHGVFVHQVGDCSAGDGTSTGDYFRLSGSSGAEGARLGEVLANVAGQARGSFTSEGALTSLLERAVMIEAEATEGGSLRKLACGVIRPR